MTEEICDVCNEEAIYKVFGGTPKQPPGEWTDAVPHPENYTFRCQKHMNGPEPEFGKLWKWYPKDRFPQLFSDGLLDII